MQGDGCVKVNRQKNDMSVEAAVLVRVKTVALSVGVDRPVSLDRLIFHRCGIVISDNDGGVKRRVE